METADSAAEADADANHLNLQCSSGVIDFSMAPFCDSDKPKSGLVRDLGARLPSRNVPFGASGDFSGNEFLVFASMFILAHLYHSFASITNVFEKLMKKKTIRNDDTSASHNHLRQTMVNT